MLSDSAFTAWNESVGEAISALGHRSFGDHLAEALGCIVGFDTLSLWAYGTGDRVVSVYSTFDASYRSSHMGMYASHFFRIDPFYRAVREQRLNEIVTAHHSWRDRECRRYYSEHFQPAGFGDEVGFGFTLDGETTLVLSLLRRQGHGLFEPDHADALRWIQPTAVALARRQWTDLKTATAENGGIEERLTSRERQVVELIIAGCSSDAIALRLNISLGTVKVHRKNLYQKLGISSQGELFHLWLAPQRQG